MTFVSDTLYALVDPERYDDDFGEGFDHVLSAPNVDGCAIADCWVVDAEGARHPGYDESPVPVRFEDVISCPMQHLRRLRSAREAATP